MVPASLSKDWRGVKMMSDAQVRSENGGGHLDFPNGFWTVHGSRHNIREAHSSPRGLSHEAPDEARGTLPTGSGCQEPGGHTESRTPMPYSVPSFRTEAEKFVPGLW